MISTQLFAFPDTERTALEVSGITSQATSFLLDDDRFLYFSFSDDILRIDTETWALTTDQVPALADNTDEGGDDLTGDIAGLAIQGDTLFATQADGDLLTIDLDDFTADPETTDVIDGILGDLAADTEGGEGNDLLYLLDKTNNAVIVYDVVDGVQATIPLTDDQGAEVTPVAVVFVPFPTGSSNSTTDKIFVTSNNGLLFVLNEGGTSVASTITLSSTSKELPAAAPTPDGDFLLVVNATDVSVHVIDTNSEAEVDTDSATAGTNPVALPDNAGLEGVVVASVSDPDDTYAFVTGSHGISVIDLNIGETQFQDPDLLDFDDEGATDENDDPLALSAIPGPILASTDGYLYASNSDATLSVISDNPFVTISGTSLGSDALTTDGSFTITFQADETGTYRVLVGGDLTGTGTELTSGTVDAASTDVTTVSISYDATLFDEGTNRLFVFVTDGEGNDGRDAVDITVDTPPPEIGIVSTGFGSGKVYVTFNRLDVSDLARYNFYIDTDPAVVATKTEAAGSLPQPSSGETLEAKITGLTNGVTYYLAIEAVDQAGNVGPRTSTLSNGSAASATPERTIGFAETVGEAGCSLIKVESGSPLGVMWLVIGGVWLIGLSGLIKARRFRVEFCGTPRALGTGVGVSSKSLAQERARMSPKNRIEPASWRSTGGEIQLAKARPILQGESSEGAPALRGCLDTGPPRPSGRGAPPPAPSGRKLSPLAASDRSSNSLRNLPALIVMMALALFPVIAQAKELTPQWWSLELKGGAWLPLDQTAKDYLGSCCSPTGVVEFGFLYRSKFGFEVGTGYIGAGGTAVGASSGNVSRDGFDFTMIPIQNTVTFRADFKEDQLFVPYAKVGLDYLIFRENVQGTVTKGVKLGMHTAGGVQILLDKIDELSETMEESMGVNDIYLTLEGRYAWVNGFGGNGVNLSNLTFSGGFLFEF